MRHRRIAWMLTSLLLLGISASGAERRGASATAVSSSPPRVLGWTPILSVESAGQRRVLRLLGWAGGTGRQPFVPQNAYVGPYGFTDKAHATDIRGTGGLPGSAGSQGPAGLQGSAGPQGPAGPNVVNGSTDIQDGVIQFRHLSAGALSALEAYLRNRSAGLVLHDGFDALGAFVPADGYRAFPTSPESGPAGTIRSWFPGQAQGGGAPSHVSVDPAGGRFGGGVDFSYSGGNDGSATHDQIAYPVGSLMDPKEGTIEFWFKPHFGDGDPSASINLLGGFKKRIDSPNDVNGECERPNHSSIALAWGGWAGRKYWFVEIQGRNPTDDGTVYDVIATTPDESQPGRARFNAGQWMHFAVVWKSDGIAARGGKTLLLFVDGVEVASSTTVYDPSGLPFNDYLVVGGSGGSRFVPNSPMASYSGASGGIDNLKIWNRAKTDFSDRNQE